MSKNSGKVNLFRTVKKPFRDLPFLEALVLHGGKVVGPLQALDFLSFSIWHSIFGLRSAKLLMSKNSGKVNLFRNRQKTI